MSLTVNNSGGSKSQRIASQRKVLDEASRRRRARKGIYKFDSISIGVRVSNFRIMYCNSNIM